MKYTIFAQALIATVLAAPLDVADGVVTKDDGSIVFRQNSDGVTVERQLADPKMVDNVQTIYGRKQVNDSNSGDAQPTPAASSGSGYYGSNDPYDPYDPRPRQVPPPSPRFGPYGPNPRYDGGDSGPTPLYGDGYAAGPYCDVGQAASPVATVTVTQSAAPTGTVSPVSAQPRGDGEPFIPGPPRPEFDPRGPDSFEPYGASRGRGDYFPYRRDPRDSPYGEPPYLDQPRYRQPPFDGQYDPYGPRGDEPTFGYPPVGPRPPKYAPEYAPPYAPEYAPPHAPPHASPCAPPQAPPYAPAYAPYEPPYPGPPCGDNSGCNGGACDTYNSCGNSIAAESGRCFRWLLCPWSFFLGHKGSCCSGGNCNTNTYGDPCGAPYAPPPPAPCAPPPPPPPPAPIRAPPRPVPCEGPRPGPVPPVRPAPYARPPPPPCAPPPPPPPPCADPCAQDAGCFDSSCGGSGRRHGICPKNWLSCGGSPCIGGCSGGSGFDDSCGGYNYNAPYYAPPAGPYGYAAPPPPPPAPGCYRR